MKQTALRLEEKSVALTKLLAESQVGSKLNPNLNQLPGSHLT